MFKFVTDDVGGVGAKRKHGPKSCDSCKKKHKRCPHWDKAGKSPLSGVDDTPTHERSPIEPVALPANATNHASPEDVSSQSAPEGTQTVQPQAKSGDAYLRFVGDLSPEASFLVNRNAQDGNRNVSRHERVGVWLGQKHDEAEQEAVNEGDSADAGALARHSSAASTLRSLRPALRQECLETLPPDYEFSQLSELYYAKIDPVFPILHSDNLQDHNAMESVALKQCICLVASLDPSMRKHLRLPQTERILSQIDYRAQIAAAVKQSLDLGFMHDKMVTLQVCALMALYVDKPGCSEVSSYFVSQVVHLSQGLGLHLGWPDDSPKGEKSRRLFWCVWVLDRLNAATNGRPVLMHARDCDKRMMDSLDAQIPSFQLLIRITQYLDDTISMYRPQPTSPVESESGGTQTFEDLVQLTKTLDIGGPLLASLEMFYLSVVILRSRPRGRLEVTRSPSSEIQFFCATTIVSIATEEFNNSMTFWPILPYCVSIATSVAYKSLRNTTLPHHRKRAYVLFYSSCEVLDELSEAFLSARAVARLAKNTMQEVGRVAGSRGRNGKARETAVDNTSSNRLSGSRPKRGQQNQSDQVTAAATSARPASGVPSGHAQEASILLPSPANSWPAFGERFMPLNMDYFGSFEGENGPFEQFDPSFNLGRIDAIFSASLDPTVPHLPDDWLLENMQSM